MNLELSEEAAKVMKKALTEYLGNLREESSRPRSTNGKRVCTRNRISSRIYWESWSNRNS